MRQPHSLRPFAILSAALVCTLALPALAPAQHPTYRPSFVGSVPGASFTVPAGVNDSGQIAGTAYLSSSTRAWFADAGGAPALLPLPAGATSSKATDINRHGVVCGSVLGATYYAAAVWTPGPSGHEVRLLPGAGSQPTYEALGLNDTGDVVGRFFFGDGFAWSAGSGTVPLTPLGFLGLPGDVNEARQVVGDRHVLDLGTLQLTQLGLPTGTGYNYQFIALSSINDAGQLAGYGVVATSLPNAYQAIRWSFGGWTAYNIPVPRAGCYGLDAAGSVLYQVGSSGTPMLSVDGAGTATVQSLIEASSPGWTLTGANGAAISRAGNVAAFGGNTRTGQTGVVLLRPVALAWLDGATNGTWGAPTLTGTGTLVVGSPTTLRLASANPGSLCGLLVSTSSTPLALFGGTLHANPPLAALPVLSSSTGRIELAFAWPGPASGATWWFQYGVVDPAALGGVALSNALRGATP